MKTLQQEYQLIKEGKGNKDHFLKQARYMFPEYITTGNDFKSAVRILTSKSLLSESVGGVISIGGNQPNWFKIFNKNIKEAVGVKDTKEYGDQNSFDAIDKTTQTTLDKANFDYRDPKNIDNLYGQSFLLGYLTEMGDPKNAKKTIDELKEIVAKNMGKDINYYHTKASFGIKGIGYTKDVVGGGEPVAPKGKYKSSGYGDIPKPKAVKEGLIKELGEDDPMYFGLNDDSMSDLNQNVKHSYEVKNDKETERIAVGLGMNANTIDELTSLTTKYLKKLGITDSEQISHIFDQAYTIMKSRHSSLNEAKRPDIKKHIGEIEKQNAVLALEMKIKSIDEAIAARESKLQIAESEELAEMIDPKMVKTLQKEIKELERYKDKATKMCEKMSGKKPQEVIDEDGGMIDEGALDDQIATSEKAVAAAKKTAADAEKKLADIKAKEAAAEAAG